jgi:hypothetical protein
MKRRKGLRLVLGRSGGNAHQRRIRRRHFARQENLENERQRAEEARKARIKIPTVLIDGSVEFEEEAELYRRQQEKDLLLKALPKRSVLARFFSLFF